MTNPYEMINGQLVQMTDAEYAAFQEMQSSAESAQTIAQLKTQAQAALDKSDLVATRCFKAGVTFPSAWLTYVQTLRTIVDSGTGTIPAQPSYPANT